MPFVDNSGRATGTMPGMPKTAFSGAAALTAAALLSCAGGETAGAPPRVGVVSHLGVEPALLLEAPAARTVAVALPDVAGRVVVYARDGENILWENTDASGRPRPGGGYQLDVGPEMRLIPPHPALWSGRYRWGLLPPRTITLSSEPDPTLGLRLEKQISIDPRDGALEVVQRMKNVSDREQSYCLWDRTLCKGGGFALVPLNPRSRFPARWVIGRRKGGAWEYNGVDPAHPEMRVLDGVLVVRSGGPEQKIGADSDAGWIGYVRGSLLYVKYYPYDPGGRYTDGGLSVAFYFNERFSECEPISPEVTLRPGEEYVFPERWILLRLEREVATFEEARRAADRIPPSPFRR